MNTIPTLNFNVEQCRYKNIVFSVWVRHWWCARLSILALLPMGMRAVRVTNTIQWQDVGGQDNLRPLWRHHYTGTQALIYVIDCNDNDRIKKVRSRLPAWDMRPRHHVAKRMDLHAYVEKEECRITSSQ